MLPELRAIFPLLRQSITFSKILFFPSAIIELNNLTPILENLRVFQKKISLKVASTTFLLVYFLSLNESTCQTKKNTFHFTSKALFVLDFQIS